MLTNLEMTFLQGAVVVLLLLTGLARNGFQLVIRLTFFALLLLFLLGIFLHD